MSENSVGKVSLDLEIEGDLTKQITVMGQRIGEQLEVSIQKAMSGINLDKLTKHVTGRLAEIQGSSAKTTRTTGAPKEVDMDTLKAQIENTAQSLDITNAKIELQKKKLAELKEAYGSTFSEGRKIKLEEQILKSEAALNKLIGTSDQTGFKLAQLDAQFNSLSNGTNKANESMNKTSETAKKTGRNVERAGNKAKASGKKFNAFSSMINRSLTMLMRRMIVYNLMYRSIMTFIKYLGSAMKTNSDFASSLAQIKTNFQVAFMPIYQYILPAINALMRALATGTAYMATFVSAIFGKTYKQSFKATESLNAARKSMLGYGAAAKKTKNMLMGFDEINTLGSSDDGADDGMPGLVMPSVDVSPVSEAGKTIERIVAGIKNTFASIFQPLKNAWDNYGAGFIAEVGIFIENLKAMWLDLSSKLAYIWDNGASYMIRKIAELGLSFLTLALTIYNEFVSPLVGWVYNLISPAIAKVLEGVGMLLGKFSELIGWLLGDGKPVLDTIVIVLGSLVTAIGLVNAGMAIWNGILVVTKAVTWLATYGTTAFGVALLSVNWPLVLIVGAIAALIAIGVLLYKNWETIGPKLISVFKSIANGFIWLVNLFTKGINVMMTGILSPFNALIKGLNKVPGVNIPALSLAIPKIPMLAKGGIIDQPTLAMVGERGKEAVMPLENNTGWITELASKLSAMMGGSQDGNSFSNNDGDIVLMVGETEFGRIAIKAIKKQNRIAGTNLLLT